MAVLSALQLNQIANDFNSRRVNDLGDFLYNEIVNTAMKGHFYYERTFDDISHSLLNRIIVRMKDMFEGIAVRHDLGEHGKLTFSWADDHDMPPLIPFYEPYHELD